jgi:hypothetical protein
LSQNEQDGQNLILKIRFILSLPLSGGDVLVENVGGVVCYVKDLDRDSWKALSATTVPPGWRRGCKRHHLDGVRIAYG